MHAFIISGSRNTKGQTARCANSIADGLAQCEITSEIVFLPSLNLERCGQCDPDGWGLCRREGRCIIEDDFAVQYINELGQYLLRPIETQFFPFRFYILKEYTMNAFAAPGGHLFFFSGLIEMTEEVDELAAVVCHEIGHITARHLAHRIEQQ